MRKFETKKSIFQKFDFCFFGNWLSKNSNIYLRNMKTSPIFKNKNNKKLNEALMFQTELKYLGN